MYHGPAMGDIIRSIKILQNQTKYMPGTIVHIHGIMIINAIINAIIK